MHQITKLNSKTQRQKATTPSEPPGSSLRSFVTEVSRRKFQKLFKRLGFLSRFLLCIEEDKKLHENRFVNLTFTLHWSRECWRTRNRNTQP